MHDALPQEAIGAEAPYTQIRFDINGSNNTTTAAQSVDGGPYFNYNAVSHVSYISWLDGRDRVLTHEYGHAWSMYYAYIVQQDSTLVAYVEARGLKDEPRVNSSSMTVERIAVAAGLLDGDRPIRRQIGVLQLHGRAIARRAAGADGHVLRCRGVVPVGRRRLDDPVIRLAAR